MKKYVWLLMMFAHALPACNNNTNTNRRKENQSEAVRRNINFRNGIELYTKDVIVTDAYLIYGDDNSLVPPTNLTTAGRSVQLKLSISNGWKAQKGKVAIGAEQILKTHDGQVVWSTGDLFQNTSLLNNHDANAFTLSVVITTTDRLIEYYIVTFRIWDKRGIGEIKGSYKLYVQ